MTLLQTSEQVLAKSAQMAANDPHGVTITIVSVAVVFSALIILYIAYSLIGKAMKGEIDFKKILPARKKKTEGISDETAAAIAMALDSEMNGEAYAAISLALHKFLNDTVHDHESYIITIKRK